MCGAARLYIHSGDGTSNNYKTLASRYTCWYLVNRNLLKPILLGVAAQSKLPISKTEIAPMNTHFVEKVAYSRPKSSWKQPVVSM